MAPTMPVSLQPEPVPIQRHRKFRRQCDDPAAVLISPRPGRRS